ncbi:MAG: serine/threonine protein kinase [Proteobacteria bacterium]|nr:serine/threonine protein kinase [Pseudomonadota bacterium]
MDDLVGKCVEDKYDVEKLIASGGMGEVYLAHQKGTEQIVAIKKLKREYYQDHVAVERFINEAKVYGRVTHPNAVKLHDVLNVDGQLCIVMEYVDGKTLAQYVDEHYVFSMRQIIDIALQIADALAAVHKAGIVHRDLKTDNIMLIESVSDRFAVKILDFGIAKIKDGCPNTLTQQGTLVGTPAFMSPEQCYGMPADHRSDIYSYGLILFFIICGRLPFEASSALAMMHKQADEPLPALKRPDSSKVPGGLEGIVQKCTMKKAEDRYQSFVDVIADLTCLQEGRKTSVERSAAYAGIT